MAITIAVTITRGARQVTASRTASGDVEAMVVEDIWRVGAPRNPDTGATLPRNAQNEEAATKTYIESEMIMQALQRVRGREGEERRRNVPPVDLPEQAG